MTVLARIAPELLAGAVILSPMLCALLFGVYKCVRISFHPTAHTGCMMALAACLIGYIFLFLSAMLVSLESPDLRVYQFAVWFRRIHITFFILAMVMGCVSLLLLHRRSDDFSQGSSQAKAAVVFSTFPLLVAGYWFIRDMSS